MVPLHKIETSQGAWDYFGPLNGTSDSEGHFTFYIPPCRKTFPKFPEISPVKKRKSVSREGVLIRSYTPRPRLPCMRAKKNKILSLPLENCSSGNGKAPCWCRNPCILAWRNVKNFQTLTLFGPYRSHFLSRKSLIAAKNETKEKRWKEEKETLE